MAYLGTIVRHLEDTFHVKVHGQFHTRTEIEGTRFLTQKPDTDPDHGDKLLYKKSSLNTGTFFIVFDAKTNLFRRFFSA